jgi:hypothetical protein
MASRRIETIKRHLINREGSFSDAKCEAKVTRFHSKQSVAFMKHTLNEILGEQKNFKNSMF